MAEKSSPLPCPFCGISDSFFQSALPKCWECAKCGATGPYVEGAGRYREDPSLREDAVRRWNERAERDGDKGAPMAVTRERDRLRAELLGMHDSLHNFLNSTPLDTPDGEVRTSLWSEKDTSDGKGT